MGAAYFYHLTRRPLEQTLSMLLQKAMEAGWRTVVRGADAKHLEWLDEKLWLGPEEGFLPHGMAGGPHDADQPVLLSADLTKRHEAHCVMSIDGAPVTAEDVSALDRVCILFDGNDADAVAFARTQWKELTSAGLAAQYWSEESGRWEKKAESAAKA